MTRPAIDPVAFAEKVLALLELGRFSATYKYALFTAIMDLCVEQASPEGTHPTTLSTRQLAEKIIELYWQHTRPYEGRRILRQGDRKEGQGKILRLITEHRERYSDSTDDSLYRIRSNYPEAYRKLVREVEWKLIEMPIPRLQVIGREEDRFLYEYSWAKGIRPGQVAAYQKDSHGSEFDNLLKLKPGVVEAFKSVNGILRPLLHREWAMKVGAMNGLPESELERFLFDVDRVQLDAVRYPLRDHHGGYCFYCEEKLSSRVEVDHFIPWARYPDNGVHNLVPAHQKCNGQKRDFIAAEGHLEKWTIRIRDRGDDLEALARDAGWPHDRERSEAVAKSIYLRLPDGARLWLAGSQLVPGDRGRITKAIGILGRE